MGPVPLNGSGVLPEQALLAAYVAPNKLTLKMNWDMRAFSGGDIGPTDGNPNTFAPTGFDPDSWMAAAVAAGARSVMVQTKHHDGFAMWPTAFAVAGYSPYSIAQSAWYAANHIDVVGATIASARAHGLSVRLYFSVWDLTWQARTGTNSTTNPTGYIAMIKAQLTELLTNYGPIDAVWFDGWKWVTGYANIPFITLQTHIKGLQPATLVIDNNHEHPKIYGDVEVYETAIVGSIPGGNVRLSEEVNTIRNDGKWMYDDAFDQTLTAMRDASEIQASIANANNNAGNYLLAVTPDKAGALPPAQVTRLGEIHV